MELPESYRELQAACKRLGLRAVGKKADLRNRLESHAASLGKSAFVIRDNNERKMHCHSGEDSVPAKEAAQSSRDAILNSHQEPSPSKSGSRVASPDIYFSGTQALIWICIILLTAWSVRALVRQSREKDGIETESVQDGDHFEDPTLSMENHTMETTLEVVVAYGWITALSTGFGVVPLIFTAGTRRQHLWLGVANAMASGMMFAASGTLVYEGWTAEVSNSVHYWGMTGQARLGLGFLSGVAFVLFLAKMLDTHDVGVGDLQGAGARRALLVMAVMTLHSFAEGVGIGVAFSGAQGDRLGSFISMSLAIHNVPEGLAIAVVLIPRGVSFVSAIGWAIFSSLPQPLVAVPVFMLVSAALPWLPVGLGFAAGAMLYVGFFELLPEALSLIPSAITAVLVVCSAALMLTLQMAATTENTL